MFARIYCRSKSTFLKLYRVIQNPAHNVKDKKERRRKVHQRPLSSFRPNPLFHRCRGCLPWSPPPFDPLSPLPLCLFLEGPSCLRGETRQRQLSRHWSRLVSLSSLDLLPRITLPPSRPYPSCPHLYDTSCWCTFLQRARNRYRDSPHKYNRGAEAEGGNEERGKTGRGKRGRGKGEPTNCYTALWCHSGLLRHGPGISPEWCPRARFLLSFLRVVSPPFPSRSYPTLPPRSPPPSALSLRCWSTKGRGREGLPTCV